MEEKSLVKSSTSIPTESIDSGCSIQPTKHKSALHAYYGSRKLWKDLCKLFDKEIEEIGTTYSTFENFASTDCVLKPFFNFEVSQEGVLRTTVHQNEDKCLAVAIKLPTGITKDKVSVKIELEPIRNAIQDKIDFDSEKITTLKCIKASDAKTIYSGVFKVPEISISCLSNIPMYLMDSSEKLILKKGSHIVNNPSKHVSQEKSEILVNDVKITLNVDKVRSKHGISKLRKYKFIKEKISSSKVAVKDSDKEHPSEVELYSSHGSKLEHKKSSSIDLHDLLKRIKNIRSDEQHGNITCSVGTEAVTQTKDIQSELLNTTSNRQHGTAEVIDLNPKMLSHDEKCSTIREEYKKLTGRDSYAQNSKTGITYGMYLLSKLKGNSDYENIGETSNLLADNKSGIEELNPNLTTEFTKRLLFATEGYSKSDQRFADDNAHKYLSMNHSIQKAKLNQMKENIHPIVHRNTNLMSSNIKELAKEKSKTKMLDENYLKYSEEWYNDKSKKLQYLKTWLRSSSLQRLGSSTKHSDVAVQYCSSMVDKATDCNLDRIAYCSSHTETEAAVGSRPMVGGMPHLKTAATKHVGSSEIFLNSLVPSSSTQIQPILNSVMPSPDIQELRQHYEYSTDYGTSSSMKLSPEETRGLLNVARKKLTAYLCEDQVNLIPDSDLLDICGLLPEHNLKKKSKLEISASQCRQTTEQDVAKSLNECTVPFQTQTYYNTVFPSKFPNTNFQVYPLMVSTDKKSEDAEQESKSLEDINHQLAAEFDTLQRIYKDIYSNLDNALVLGQINDQSNNEILPGSIPNYSGSIEGIETDLKDVLDELKNSLVTMEHSFNKREATTSTDFQHCQNSSNQRNQTYFTMENEIKQTIDELLKESSCIKDAAISKGIHEEELLVYVDDKELNEVCSNILNDIVDTTLDVKGEVKDILETILNKVDKTVASISPLKNYQIGDISHSDRKKAIYFCNTSFNSKIPKTSFSFGEGVPPALSATRCPPRRREGKLTPCNRYYNEILNFNARYNCLKVKTGDNCCLTDENMGNCDNQTKTNLKSAAYGTKSPATNASNNCENTSNACQQVGIQKSLKSTQLATNSLYDLPSTSFKVETPLSDDEVLLLNVDLNTKTTQSRNKVEGAIPKKSFRTLTKSPSSSSDEEDMGYSTSKKSKKANKPSSLFGTIIDKDFNWRDSAEISLKPTNALVNIQSPNGFLPRVCNVGNISLSDDSVYDADYEGEHEAFQVHFIKPSYRYKSLQELNTEAEIAEIERNVNVNNELQRTGRLIASCSSVEFEYDDSFESNLKLDSARQTPSEASILLQVIDMMDLEELPKPSYVQNQRN